MSYFKGLKLTKLGETLLANINGNLNETLTFTSGEIGAGIINSDDEIRFLTTLKEKWKDLDIISIEKDEKDETIVKLELQFSNIDLKEAKIFREIGIYAKGNNGEPVLFAYSNAGENYDYIPLPQDNPQNFTIQINLKITSNSKIDAIINMAGFVTIGKMIEYLKNKLTQISTIAELQSRKNLKVGDIVEVLGYYSAGDGAGHKRIIASTEDLTSIKLNNGLYANLIRENNTINMKYVGAKGDGETDDTEIFLKIFKTNEFYINIFIPKGHYIINSPLKFNIEGEVYGEGDYLVVEKKSCTILDFSNFQNPAEETYVFDAEHRCHIHHLTFLCDAYNLKINRENLGKSKIYTEEILKNNISCLRDGGGNIHDLRIIGFIKGSYFKGYEHIRNIEYKFCKECFEIMSDAICENIRIISCGKGVLIRGAYTSIHNLRCDDLALNLIEAYPATYSTFTGIQADFVGGHVFFGSLSNSKIEFIGGRVCTDLLDKPEQIRFAINLANASQGAEITCGSTFFKNDIPKPDDQFYSYGAILMNATSENQKILKNNIFNILSMVSDLNNTNWELDLTKLFYCNGTMSFNANINGERYQFTDIIHTPRLEQIKKESFVSLSPASQLNSIYHLEKMKQENVYYDYITYMDEKTAYDNQQKEIKKQIMLSYQEALKENPNLTYEEFMSLQPMTLNLVEEPQPSEALKKFMSKYL